MSASSLPPIPYGRQWIDDDDVAALAAAARSDYLTQGPEVAAFERDLAARCGAPFAVAVNSGTAALHLACAAAGLGEGDVSLTTPLTFVASANAARYCGAEVRLADIDPSTRNISPERIELAFADAPAPKVIVPVHFAGVSCDMPKIARLARARGAVVIEDACHAIGARYRDEQGAWIDVGSCAHSDMTCFSFHPVKHVTTGEGGAITTRSEALYRRLLLLRTHGITKDPALFEEHDDERRGPWYYEMHSLGWNYRITDLQCALGRSQLDKLDRFVARRRQIAARYHDLLGDLRGVTLPFEPEGCESSFHLYAIHVDEALAGRSRRAVFDALHARGVLAQVHYMPVHMHPYYRRRYGDQAGRFPEAERFYEGAISLPMFPRMTDADVERVARALRESLAR